VSSVNVRAVYRSATVSGYSPPYDTLTLKVYYPSRFGDTFDERNSGLIPADPGRAPFPAVIFMPGVNLSHEAYGWLARKLGEAGFAVLTYSWVTKDFDGAVGIGPGVQLKRLTPKRYGGKPSCPALPALFSELKRLNKRGVLKGLLDLERVVLGGHSAGGTMALLNANRDWFPALRGAFSYGAHTAANRQLGWPENSIMPLAKDLPFLIMGGTRDGVIAASGHRYGDDESKSTELLERTFREGIKGKRGGRHLLLVKGANHFAAVWPRDDSTGRGFLDGPQSGDNKKIREYLAQVIVNFCDYVCTGNAMSGAELQGLCNGDHPLAARAEHK